MSHFLVLSESSAYEPMTFPSYGPLARSIGRDASVVALGVSFATGRLACSSLRFNQIAKPAIMHSMYVAPTQRGQGIAMALLRRMERALAERGCVSIRPDYMTGKPSTPAVERVLQKCGGAPPQTPALTAKLSADALTTVPWVSRDRLPPDFSTFPWRELTDRDRQSIAQRQETEFWIHSELIPFRHERDFEPQTSLGLRYQEQVVEWMINHVIDSSTLRLTCAWAPRDVQRVDGCIPLRALVAELRNRAADAGFQHFIWMASPSERNGSLYPTLGGTLRGLVSRVKEH